jgi:replicative DNA helicase
VSAEDEVAEGEGEEAAAIAAPPEEETSREEDEGILSMGDLEETEPPLEPHPRPPRSRLSRFRLQEQLDALEKSLEPEFAALWPNRGLRTSFPLLCDSLDGFRNYLYVVAGGSRMGKSTMCLQIAYDLVRMHEDARVLYLSLDQPVRDTQLRLVGMAGQCHLQYLADPDPEKDKKYERKKRKGLQAIRRLRERMFIVDESEGAIDIDEIRAMVEELRTERSDGPLFLVIDPIYKIRVDGLPVSASLDDITGFLARELKTIAMEHRCGVIVSTRLDRGAGEERPLLSDLEEQSGLLYEAAAVMLL